MANEGNDEHVPSHRSFETFEMLLAWNASLVSGKEQE